MERTLNDLKERLCAAQQTSQSRLVMNAALYPCSITDIQKLGKAELWNYRMGHGPVHTVINSGCITKTDTKEGRVCVVCPMAKFTKLLYHLSTSHAAEIFHLIHVDIWGEYRVETRGKHRYFLNIVDDCYRNTWVHLLKEKSDAFKTIEEFMLMVKNQFNKIVKIIRLDNGMEFEDHKCQALFGALDIVHQTSCVGRLQQNGRVERKHRNILEMGKALRFQVGLPLHFWGDCVLTAAYITNRLPTPILKNRTP